MADTEQEGAPSATAGGASAPDLSAIRDVVLDSLRAVPLWQFRQGLVTAGLIPADAEIQAVERKPVNGEPGIRMEWDEDVEAMRIDGISWDLSFGCTVSFAYDHDKGEHYVCVSTSDADQRAGITSRRTTKEQLASFGQQLLNVFGEPDPRDAETDRMRGELCRIRDIALVVLNVLPDDDDRSAVDLVREILESAGPEKLRRDKQFRDLVAERDRKRRELADVTAERDRLRLEVASARSIANEKRAVAKKLRGQIEELETQRDQRQGLWQVRYGQLIGGALAVQQHLQRAAGKLIHPSDEFDKDFSRSVVDELVAERDDYAARLRATDAGYAKATAERDRLRQDLDFIARQPQGSNPYWQLRSKRVEDERDRLREELDRVAEQHATGLVTLRTDFTAAVNGLLPKPAELSGEAACKAGNEDYSELSCTLSPGHAGSHRDRVQGAIWSRNIATPAKPRRWVAGDPEPEIGVTVRRTSVADYYQRWTRMPNGSWHPNHACRHEHADQCSGLMFAEWKQLPRPLVEVVNSDG